MNAKSLIQQLKLAPLVTCQIKTPALPSKRVGQLKLSVEPPEEPGVYLVYHLQKQRPFYVGEASNLRARLKFLFRCNAPDNPHPCHRRHKEVFGEMPDVHVFCKTYGVHWLSTAGLVGRLEIEEEIQKQLGTNRKRFYMDFDSEHTPADKNLLAGQDSATNTLTGKVDKGGGMDGNGDNVNDNSFSCNGCPIWFELSSNPNYRSSRGIFISTMAGRGENLLFCFDPSRNAVHVWRDNGKPDFWFGEQICKRLCLRYQQGLKSGVIFPSPSMGGTSFFNNPKWGKPPLGQINTPFAAAVIHFVWPKAPGNC